MIRKLASRVVLPLALCVTLAACKSPEERAEDYFASAQALLATGDTDRAVIELRNVFRLVPYHVEARRSMAQLMLAQGNRKGAYAQYTRLVEQVPEDVEGRTVLAELSLETRDWDEFARHGEKAIELAPDAPRSQAIGVALAYRAAVIDEDAEAVAVIQAQARTLTADIEGGNHLLERVLYDGHLRAGENEEALAVLDRMIDRDPSQRLLFDQRLVLLRETGASRGAVETHLRRVVAAFPDEIDAKRQVVQYFMAAGQADKAEAFLRDISDPADEDPAMFLSLVTFLEDVRGRDAARAELDAGIPLSPAPDRLRMLRAALDFDGGDRDAAIAALQTILDSRAPDTEAEEIPAETRDLTNEVRTTLSKMLRATGDDAGAQQLLDEVLASDPGNAPALKIQAAQLIETDDADAAISNLRQVLDVTPEDVEALSLMAEAHFRAGSPDLARDFLARAVNVSDHAPAPSMAYARALLRDNNNRAAEEILLATLRQRPAEEEVLAELGAIYLSREDFGRAEAVTTQLRRIGSTQAAAMANRLQTELVARRQGSTEAIALLEGMAREESAGLGEQVLLLRARLAAGEQDKALQMAEDLVAAAPENLDRRFLRAVTRGAVGDLVGARVDLRGILEEDPTRVASWQQLYRLERIAAGPDAAGAVLEAALKANPDAPVLMWIQAGALEQAGDIDGAIALYEDLYARDTSSMIFANNLASLLVTHRADDASLDRAWRIARRLRDTEVPAFQDTYGWLAFRRGDAQTALPYLEAAAKGLPQDALVQYHLAEAYAALERSQEAMASYRHALKIAGPDDNRPQLSQARDKLAALEAAEAAAAAAAAAAENQ